MLFSYLKSWLSCALIVVGILVAVSMFEFFFPKLFVMVGVVLVILLLRGLYKLLKEDYESYKYRQQNGIVESHIKLPSFRQSWREYKEAKNRYQSS